ncbi:Polyprotein [Pyrenophora teres f. teres]|uniref:Polyprotein n=1 Tax=Pyrenophora teres f. teres TaxID=97479 RepID=A0A6S6VT40_9PLEO|nr:Polyprotein [Pyrenophora teres f. teres]
MYVGPPDTIATDAGTNFASEEFVNNANAMMIDVHEVPVEAHQSIGKVERYHAAIRRAFEVISADIGTSTTTKDDILQMAVKAINDTAGPKGLVPTLLVFGTYPRLSKTSPPSPSITARATAIRKAMAEVRKIKAKRQVNEALGTRNGPNDIFTQVLELPLQSNVKVWREGLRWTGPHTLIALNNDQTAAIVDTYGKQASFRITSVQPYHQDDTTNLPRPDEEQHSDEEPHSDHQRDNDEFVPQEEPPQRRGRGCPKGSKNKPKTHAANLAQREKDDIVLARTLRTTGKITTPGEPFEMSTRTEIDGLITRGVFRFEPFDPAKHGGIRIFKSRIFNEVKGKTTDRPYEKSRLVVQGYADHGKKIVLTQSPTIQRASQRIIIALAPSLIQMGMKLWLRDITQAYTQSDDRLQRTIIAELPIQLRKAYPQGTIMVVVKPLYGIAEAGAYWWSTYFKHHTTTLNMETSTYDPCLLISKATDAGTTTGFGIVGMQTDDTLGLSDNTFADREDKELRFKAKDKQYLTDTEPIEFNGCTVRLGSDSVITLRQKKQGEKLESAVDMKSYVQQRARGAYIATICQPEASFDLAAAAQATEPTKEEISRLNKRINWQKKNVARGLSYVPVKMEDLKLYAMVDASFANNKDMSSQIGYVIILGNEVTSSDGSFKIRGNIVHWSSTKCKRVTRSVLASEIYAMAHGVDIALAIGTTIDMIMDRLSLPKVPIVACTDSRSLYDCLVKLGTTKEKRLMIDIMALREAYERSDLMDIRWIDGRDNPADAMTKAASNSALEHLIDTNELELRVQGWVNRDSKGTEHTSEEGSV